MTTNSIASPRFHEPNSERSIVPASDLPPSLARYLTVERLVWMFVGIGVALRLSRYLAGFPLWSDEYQLSANFLNRGFADLLRPLEYNQVAPIGFLTMELAATKHLGFSELSLRLFPATCAVLSVFLFRDVASRLLRGMPLVFAMGVFAIAYYPIRLGAEVKPYASDLLVSLALTSLAVRWWENPRQVRWLVSMTALAPFCLSVSFPAAFVTGGLSLGIAWTLWQNRALPESRKASLAWIAFNLTVAVSFLGLMRLSVGAQYDATRNEMTQCWSDGFPPWRQPLQLVGWLISVHTSEMFAYPFGAENGASTLTFLMFLIGIVETIRRGRHDVAVTVGGWFALSLIAAALHRYPYGGHARLSQYLAPAICLLSGAGGAVLVSKLRSERWQAGVIRIGLGLCAVIAVVLSTRDWVRPYKVAEDHAHREFARKFWTESPDEVTLCLRTDLGLEPYQGSVETAYLCNQRIYSPVHRVPGREGRTVVEAADRPLRCVALHSASARENGSVLADWMREMSIRYDLTEHERHEVPLMRRQDALAGLYLQCYDVYHFVPRGMKSASSAESSGRMASDPSSENTTH